MSVDIDWETLTGGPDGAALAEVIRDFIHERFQAINLPKLIRSVTIHKFEFGKVAPHIQIKDICDPLPDFYESDEDDTDSDVQKDDAESKPRPTPIPHPMLNRPLRNAHGSRRQSELDLMDKISSPGLTRGSTPAMLGTTSHLGYFHIPLSGGLHGSQTPLAAVAGAHYGGNHQVTTSHHRHSESLSSITPPSSVTPVSSQGHAYFDGNPGSAVADDADAVPPLSAQLNQLREVGPEDLQVVFHVTYAGDIRLSLTADVFLDYPMPSFVGIPLKLKITGLTFNGVGILAYIRKRAHLCFLSPDDAEALVGREAILDPLDHADGRGESSGAPKVGRVGALLEDIKIESEMGETDSGKQVLKNVDKIEKFILEQVQRIFEDEFVYPSYWTFLV